MAASDLFLTGEFRREDDPNLPGLCLFNNPDFPGPALLQPLGGGLGSGELLEDPGDLVGVEKVLLTAEFAADLRHTVGRRGFCLILSESVQHRDDTLA